MTTCQDVITRALRKLNATRLGAPLKTAEAANALVVLQSLYMELVGWGAFGRVNDILSSGNWTALPNQRVRMDDPNADVEIPDDLPVFPCWWNPCWPSDSWMYWPVWPVNPVWPGCQAPRDLSVVTIVDPNGGEAFTYLYDAYVGRWRQLEGLTLETEAPLSRRWPEPLANVLAGRLAPDYGLDIPPALQLAIRNGLQAITQRFGDSSPPVRAEYY